MYVCHPKNMHSPHFPLSLSIELSKQTLGRPNGLAVKTPITIGKRSYSFSHSPECFFFFFNLKYMKQEISIHALFRSSNLLINTSSV